MKITNIQQVRSLDETIELCRSAMENALNEKQEGRPAVHSICDDCDKKPNPGYNCNNDKCLHYFDSSRPVGAAVEMARALVYICKWFEDSGISTDMQMDLLNYCRDSIYT